MDLYVDKMRIASFDNDGNCYIWSSKFTTDKIQDNSTLNFFFFYKLKESSLEEYGMLKSEAEKDLNTALSQSLHSETGALAILHSSLTVDSSLRTRLGAEIVFSFFIESVKLLYFITDVKQQNSPKIDKPLLSKLINDLKSIQQALQNLSEYIINNPRVNLFKLYKSNYFLIQGLKKKINLENEGHNVLHNLHLSIETYKNHELLREIPIDEPPREFDIYPLVLDVLTKLIKFLFEFFGDINQSKFDSSLLMKYEDKFTAISSFTQFIIEEIEYLGVNNLENHAKNNEKAIINIKASISILICFLDSPSTEALPYELMQNGPRLVKVSGNSLMYRDYTQAFKIIITLLKDLDPNSMLFCAFSFANSKIITKNDENYFEFDNSNTFGKTQKDIIDSVPEYFMVYDSDKEMNVGYVTYALSDYSKLIFFNRHYFKYEDRRKNIVGIMLLLLHELFHIKRMSFNCKTIKDFSPFIKVNESDQEKNKDIGTFAETYLLVIIY
jgi:hypothetical protein